MLLQKHEYQAIIRLKQAPDPYRRLVVSIRCEWLSAKDKMPDTLCCILFKNYIKPQRLDPAHGGFDLRFIGDGFYQTGGYTVESPCVEPQIRIFGFQHCENLLFHVLSFYMVLNVSSHSGKKRAVRVCRQLHLTTCNGNVFSFCCAVDCIYTASWHKGQYVRHIMQGFAKKNNRKN